MDLQTYTFKERRPSDGAQCWVQRYDMGYATLQVYNEYHGCWDTWDGDDYEYDIDDEDKYIELPDTL